jgi:uncharacterized protein YjiS (DUF1127 family)
MAYANTSRAVHPGLAERFAGLVASFKIAAARRAIYNQTQRELFALTDRELNDLGIERSNIAQVAHEAAYGN